MSIANEILRLQGVKADIKAAIADKGVDVPADAMLGDCSALIGAISGGGECSVYPRLIVGESGIKVVDANGYVGLVVNSYYSHDGSEYKGNYAIVVDGADFSALGLGRVTFIEYGKLEIGGLEYKTVTIGTQTWMAENLQLETDNSWFYNNDEATYGRNGKNYGRLYTFYAAKAITVAGWHLPSKEEWQSLLTAVGNDTSGTKLKSTTGWTDNGNGTDDFGFSVLPAGQYRSSGFDRAGYYGRLWTSTKKDDSFSYELDFVNDKEYANMSYNGNDDGYSVRLIKDA